MSYKKPLPYSYYKNKKLSKLGISDSKTESIDEYLARGGQINTIKADGRKYLSHEDREYGYDEMMQQRGFSQSVSVVPDVTKDDDYDNHWDDDGPEFDSKNVPFHIRSKLYDTQEWKSLRYKFIQTKNTGELVCAQCGKGPFTKENWKDMNVDHIKPVKHFWEERLNIDNLQILCWICNRVKMNHYNEPFKLGDGAKSVLRKTKKKKKSKGI
tara:strand:+ start:52 stop:687 length:636 start_codon:yes stop_codon:yes gene_type:complete